MPAAYLVVRATVSDPAKWAAFDRWYSKEHLPDAAKSFGVEKAWRFWSLSDPALHQATYRFSDQAALDRAMNGDDLKRLVTDFDRDWPGVTWGHPHARAFGAGRRVQWGMKDRPFAGTARVLLQQPQLSRVVQRTFISTRQNSLRHARCDGVIGLASPPLPASGVTGRAARRCPTAG